MAPSPPLDCQRCGACCCNPPDNVRAGFTAYVEVARGDEILACPELVRRYVTVDAEGAPHLRLDPAGRCLALSGAVGGRVRCRIYHQRPSPCRRVQAGSDLCHRYRETAGL